MSLKFYQLVDLTHLPDNKILDRSKLKQSADDNFKFDENSSKFSKRVENTVGKGEIARYEQFLLFLRCFQKACFPGASKGVIVREWVKGLTVNPLAHFNPFPNKPLKVQGKSLWKVHLVYHNGLCIQRQPVKK